jgi:hypothetical protein
LFHGRLLLAARSHQLLLHASLDPYNTTEEMDVSWTDMELVWSEASIRQFSAAGFLLSRGCESGCGSGCGSDVSDHTGSRSPN